MENEDEACEVALAEINIREVNDYPVSKDGEIQV